MRLGKSNRLLAAAAAAGSISIASEAGAGWHGSQGACLSPSQVPSWSTPLGRSPSPPPKTGSPAHAARARRIPFSPARSSTPDILCKLLSRPFNLPKFAVAGWRLPSHYCKSVAQTDRQWGGREGANDHVCRTRAKKYKRVASSPPILARIATVQKTATLISAAICSLGRAVLDDKLLALLGLCPGYGTLITSASSNPPSFSPSPSL